MSVTNAAILDAARQRLHDILVGGVAEYAEGNERARLLEITQLQNTIDSYEQKVAAADGSYGVSLLQQVDL